MDETAFAVDLKAGKPGDTATETPRSKTVLLGFENAPPPGCDVTVTLADGQRLAYVPSIEGPDAGAVIVANPLMRGNAFVLSHESPRCLGALMSVAAGRRVETGPESERSIVVVRGNGLVFLENGDTLRFEPGTLVIIHAGEPARIWSQGPDDALCVVLQPQGAREERRTLASEILRKRTA